MIHENKLMKNKQENKSPRPSLSGVHFCIVEFNHELQFSYIYDFALN